ncbi:MAG: hypothetical protein ACKO7W_16200, partial [Elainella sp.]
MITNPYAKTDAALLQLIEQLGENEKKGGEGEKGVVSDKKERRGTTPNAIRVYRKRAIERTSTVFGS